MIPRPTEYGRDYAARAFSVCRPLARFRRLPGVGWALASPLDWWGSIHQAIYERENRIAFLEADPETDDGYRAPIISRHRAEIRRLHAALGPAQWQWTTPCCYSRPADLHRLVMASPAVPLASLSFRASTPQVQAEP